MKYTAIIIHMSFMAKRFTFWDKCLLLTKLFVLFVCFTLIWIPHIRIALNGQSNKIFQKVFVSGHMF